MRCDVGIMKDDGVLIVMLLSTGAEIIGAGDHNIFVDDDHLMVHFIGIPVQTYDSPTGQ